MISQNLFSRYVWYMHDLVQIVQPTLCIDQFWYMYTINWATYYKFESTIKTTHSNTFVWITKESNWILKARCYQ